MKNDLTGSQHLLSLLGAIFFSIIWLKVSEAFVIFWIVFLLSVIAFRQLNSLK